MENILKSKKEVKKFTHSDPNIKSVAFLPVVCMFVCLLDAATSDYNC